MKISRKKKPDLLFVFGFMLLLITGCSQPASEIISEIPVLTGTVSIGGTARVGQTLTANTGNIGGNETVSCRWQRSVSAMGAFADISGAVGKTYQLVSADENKFIRVTVSRTGYSGSVNSGVVGPVTGLDAGTVSSVTVTPKAEAVIRGGTRQFSAVVAGSAGVSQSVTWSITGTHSANTTISAAGLLSVASGESANSLIIMAVSNADSAKSDTATVTITNPAFVEKYTKMYILGGEAGIGNWASGASGTEMVKQPNGIFMWEGTLQEETQFKFHDAAANDWDSGNWFHADGDGVAASGTKTVIHSYTSGNNNAWKITVAGTYGITLDTESLLVTFVTLTPGLKPSVPAGLTKTAVTANSLSVSWIEVFGAEAYNVYAGTSASTKTLRGSPTSASYTITGLSPGTTYYISVTARNTAGESDHSSQITAVTTSSVPTGLTKDTVTSNSVNLVWTGVTGAAGYRIYAGTTLSNMTLRGYASSTNYTLSLQSNTTYYIAVSAENSGGESERSSAISVKTKLPAPSGVTAAPIQGTNTIQISWNTLAGASSYRIYRSTTSTSGYTLIGTTTGTTHNDNDRTQSTAYYYKVSAVASEGDEGDQSQPSSATITTASNDISFFKFADFAASGDINAVINGTNITVTVPSIVNLTTLVPTISHNGTSIAPASGVAQDFSIPLIYTVAAGNGSLKYYTVTVTVANDSLAAALAWLGNNAKNNRTYTIIPKRAEAIAPTTLSYNYKTVGIILKGGSSECIISLSGYGSLFTVGSYATLTLDNNITLQGKTGNTASLVKLDSSAQMVMNTGAKVTGNTISLLGNDAEGYGGGVYVGSGNFIMNGGTVSNNTVTFTGNYGTGRGGGVYVGSSGEFTMNGGTISGNSISNKAFNAYGGGVFIGNGSFTMKGGTISGNTAASSAIISEPVSRGGGVYVDGSAASCTMQGGTISGNTASSSASLATTYAYGGGVSVNAGTFKKTGGSISSNSLSASTRAGTVAYVLLGSTTLKRDTAAGTGVNLDSTKTGSAGGWE